MIERRRRFSRRDLLLDMRDSPPFLLITLPFAAVFSRAWESGRWGSEWFPTCARAAWKRDNADKPPRAIMQVSGLFAVQPLV